MEISELYPKGDDSVGEFYSVAVTNNMQQADTGTKMVHVGKNTKSTIISKGFRQEKRKTVIVDWCVSARRRKMRGTFTV